MRGRDPPRRRLPDRGGARRDGMRERVRPARPVPGRRAATAELWRRGAPAQHGLALPPPDPGLLGRARRKPRPYRPPRPDPRDRPPFRPFGRRYGRDRGAGGVGAEDGALPRPLAGEGWGEGVSALGQPPRGKNPHPRLRRDLSRKRARWSPDAAPVRLKPAKSRRDLPN